MRALKLAEGFPPSEFVQRELDARGWTQDDLAAIMKRPVAFVNQLANGKKIITAKTAKELGEAFGTGAEFWMNLESMYRLHIEENAADDIRIRARIFELIPVRDVQKRGWIPRTDSTTELQARVCEFLAIESLDQEPRYLKTARTSKLAEDGSYLPTQKAWAARCLQLARGVATKPFRPSSMRQLYSDLKSLINEPEEMRNVPRLLADYGIRMVVVQHLPKSKMDGAALWLSNEKPVLAISMRFDRIDHVTHTIFHELAHIEDGEHAFDHDLMGSHEAKTEAERKIDARAASTILDGAALDKFVLRKSPRFRKEDVVGFSVLNGLHPGIVVGQLQFRGEVGYEWGREFLVPVRKILTGSAMTDGWGVSVSPD